MKRNFIYIIVAIISIGTFSLSASDVGAYSNSNQISDAVFYNKASMSHPETQIQNFINKFPSSCLNPKNYPKNLPPITFKEPLDYWTYSSKDVSPARIIYDASQYYTLNPQVILTTLEKENNFITGKSDVGCPVWAYNSAMGYDCTESNSQADYPKSKIYNTCVGHESNAGFARQVNHAAWQLSFDGKRANGDLSWNGDGDTYYYGRMTKGYRARVNGQKATYYDGYTVINGKSVYLDNGPTAALYNYTPHFTSFDSIFTKWFGNTNYIIKGAIKTYYNNLGGANSFLGGVLSNEIKTSNGGRYQKFEHGRIYWSSKTGAHNVHGGIQTRFLELGGDKSSLGLPVGDEIKVTDGVYQKFEHGRIYWSSKTGAQAVRGALQTRYLKLDAEQGILGFPTSDGISVDGGAYQTFENGTMYWSSKTGAWVNRGGIRTQYLDLSAEQGILGFPTSDGISVDGGAYQTFENGRIYWNSKTGTTVIRGALLTKYLKLDAEQGILGFPTSDGISVDGGAYQTFENGTMYWSSSTKAWAISGVMENYYESQNTSSGRFGFPLSNQVTDDSYIYQKFQGGTVYIKSGADNPYIVHGGIEAQYTKLDSSNSSLGFPVSNEIKISGGVYQKFQGGNIYWSSATSAWSVSGTIESYYNNQGATSGKLGFPVNEQVVDTSHVHQSFQGGDIYTDTNSGKTYLVHGGILSKYNELRSSSGYLGYPMSDEIKSDDGSVYQEYRGGRIYWSSKTGSWSTHGGIQAKYIALGANHSYLGLPISDEIKTSGGSYQEYQGGRIYWSSKTGAWSTHGAIQSHYLRIGGPSSKLGFPKSDELPDSINGGVYQKFYGGTIHWRRDGWEPVYYY